MSEFIGQDQLSAPTCRKHIYRYCELGLYDGMECKSSTKRPLKTSGTVDYAIYIFAGLYSFMANCNFARTNQSNKRNYILTGKALDLHSISMPFILIDPLLDDMRDEQRFIDLVAKMNLQRG